MTWTYDGDPSANDRDEVRFLVGDTDTTDQLVSDEEIAYAVADQNSNKLAAAYICEAIAAKFARDVDVRVGRAAEDASQRYKQYKELAAKYRGRANVVATPRFGGVSRDAKDDIRENDDAVLPSFERNMGTRPNTANRVDSAADYDEDCR